MNWESRVWNNRSQILTNSTAITKVIKCEADRASFCLLALIIIIIILLAAMDMLKHGSLIYAESLNLLLAWDLVS